MSKEVEKVTEDAFRQVVSQGAVLVDFYADWCGPCRMMTPVLEKVAKEMHGNVKVIKVDIDHAQQVSSQFQITSVPTLVLLKEGKETGRLVGLQDAEAIKGFVQSC